MSGVGPVQSGIAVLVLLGVTITTATLRRIRIRAGALIAPARAAVQMIGIALVIAWVFRHPEGVVLYLGVMVLAATITSSRRIRCEVRVAPLLCLSIVARCVRRGPGPRQRGARDALRDPGSFRRSDHRRVHDRGILGRCATARRRGARLGAG
jgi:hypothetical protein